MSSSFSPLFEIDFSALAENVRLLRQQAGARCRLAGVVKADAYGLGAERVAPLLSRLGAPCFFVATFEEGAALRRVTRKPIYILNGVRTGPMEAFARLGLHPVLNCLEDAALWREEAAQQGRPLPCALHFDTGMNRLGFGAAETVLICTETDLRAGLDIRLVMSHFACADEDGHPMTDQQFRRFSEILPSFPGVPASLANSAALFSCPESAFDLARPGAAVYGLAPVAGRSNPMRRVVRLRAPVLQLRSAPAGESVGYGAGHRLDRPSRLATVGLGYAAGLLRSGGGRASLFAGDTPCPVLGRVNMDAVVVDVTDAAAPLHPGDFLEVLGPRQSADDLAASCGTIGYEILTSLGSRLKRVYV